MNTAMTFETSERANDIDRLLARTCLGKFEVSYKLVRREELGSRKMVRVNFTSTKDRDRFRAALRAAAGKRVAAPPPAPRRSPLQSLFGH
jgi:hypothetical protein